MTTFAPGKYYVGDLCYALRREGLWEVFCEDLNGGEYILEHEGKSIRVWWDNTQYGDGEYRNQFGHAFSVDAGLIGVVAYDDLNEQEKEFLDVILLGHIYNFEQEFTCSRDNSGTFYIGEYVIPTGDEDEIDDYFEEDEYEDEGYSE